MLCGKSYCTSEPAINETDRLEALGHSNPSFSSSSFSSPSSPCRKNLTLKTAHGSSIFQKTDRGLADLGRLSKGETPWFQWPMGLHLYLRLGWSSFQVGKDGRNLGKVGSHRSFGKSDNRGAILVVENGLLFENATCKVCLLCFFLQAFDTVMSFLRLPGT